MDNVEKIYSAMPLDTAAWISSPSSCRYLSGFSADNCLCLLSKSGAFYFTDKRYLEAAQKNVAKLEVVDIEKLEKLVKSLPEKSFAIESEYTTLAAAARRRKKYPDLAFLEEFKLDEIISALRAVKTSEEINNISKAQAIAQAAFEQVLPNIYPGRTEKEIALDLDFAMLSLGAEKISFDTIVAGGENGSLPHGVPASRKLREGELLTLDFGAVYNGYHSDMTRTIAIGKPSAEQRELYDLVCAAQDAGLRAVRPGVACKDVDAAVRAVFNAEGMGEYFTHSTGHGLGLDIHEAPTVSHKSEELLCTGMVLTIEPGLYLPGRLGLRIEDTVVVGAGQSITAPHTAMEGCLNLTLCSKNLRSLN